MAKRLILAIDTGGTFTDCVYRARGRVKVFKLPSTPDDPGRAILEAVETIAAEVGVEGLELRHGTTVGTNALLERKGARVAFVTTEGFEDTLVIGRQARPDLYDWNVHRSLPLAEPGLCFGVAERVAPDGSVVRALQASTLAELRERVRSSGAESIAVSLLFSFAHPEHERAVAAALEPLGLPVSLSHQVLPEFREYERASTVTLNAYLAPRMAGYIGGLERSLSQRGAGLSIMQSSGGILSAQSAAREPVRTILSGPAGGVIGALSVARRSGIDGVISFDMGGTSTDVALLHAQQDPATTIEGEVGGLPIRVPMLDIHTAGAGGGSLAWMDAAGMLRVGPQSAGANPGPACYGRGEDAAVTDANLALGRLHADHFLGGAMRLDGERARAALQSLHSRAAGFAGIEELAEGIVHVANAHMESALRRVSVERGFDPRSFTLLAFGGSGPLHACALASALGVRKVLVPAAPGALSALGILDADLRREFSRTVMADPGSPRIATVFRELEAEAREAFRGEGVRPSLARSADLRYQGQGFEIRIAWGARAVEHFHRTHARLYGYEDRGRAVEVVTVRVQAVASTHKPPHIKARLKRGDGAQARVAAHRIFEDGRWRRGALYRARVAARGRPRGGSGYHCGVECYYVCPERLDSCGGWVRESGAHTGVEAAPEAHAAVRDESSKKAPMRQNQLDPAEIAVLGHALHSVAVEMGAVLRRTAFSPNIKERRDYSSAVFSGQGDLIAMGDDMPVHLGSMPMSVAAVLAAMKLGPGDVALLNDPYRGGTHLPDITMVAPVYLFRGTRPAFYVANRAHHADVGGMYPGSMGLCREIAQEGIRIPPVKLMRAGKMDRQLLDVLLANVRTPREREGDLTAQMGACRIGAERVRELVDRFGHTRIVRGVEAMIEGSARLMETVLAGIPAGVWHGEDFLDEDGVRPEPVGIRVAVRNDPVERKAIVDFTGSDVQVPSSLNAVYAVTWAAVFYVFRCLLPQGAVATAGLMRPIRVIAPEGTIVNAVPPAAVAGGNVETSQRIVDTLLRALAGALPSRIPAASSGTMNNLTIGGIDPRSGLPYTYYETIAGGLGASPQGPGASGHHAHMTNSLNTPVEALEYAYPFRMIRYAVRRKSGGEGMNRGGNGLVREIELLGDAQVTLLCDRRQNPSVGVGRRRGRQVRGDSAGGGWSE